MPLLVTFSRFFVFILFTIYNTWLLILPTVIREYQVGEWGGHKIVYFQGKGQHNFEAYPTERNLLQIFFIHFSILKFDF